MVEIVLQALGVLPHPKTEALCYRLPGRIADFCSVGMPLGISRIENCAIGRDLVCWQPTAFGGIALGHKLKKPETHNRRIARWVRRRSLRGAHAAAVYQRKKECCGDSQYD